MASVTITLIDTPTGGVAVQSNYVPALGKRSSTAQIAALEIINRTCREYGLPNPLRPVSLPLRDGVDIDAVHHRRDNVVDAASTVVSTAGKEMNIHRHKLTQGKALVITGPQASGKTTLALKIASCHGKYQQVDAGAGFEFQLNDALNGQIDVLIIEGNPTAAVLEHIKALLSSTTTMVRLAYGKGHQTIPSPHVIICAQDTHWLHDESRRFDVIDLSMETSK